MVTISCCSGNHNLGGRDCVCSKPGTNDVTLLGEHHQILDNLKLNLLKVVGGSLVDSEEDNGENHFRHMSLAVMLLNKTLFLQ